MDIKRQRRQRYCWRRINMAKKAAAKKTESKKEVKKAPAKKMVKVMRFNVKDGERYPMEVEESEVLTHINGDVGLKDLIL